MNRENPRQALVMGAGGFIGSHMVTRLVKEGYFVVGVDLVEPKFSSSSAQVFRLGDCSKRETIRSLFDEFSFDEIYQFAADMGGAGYIFSGENDFNVMENSAGINIALCGELVSKFKESGNFPRVFYSSSACIYPAEIQTDPDKIDLAEESAYPANPDSEYGWEKLFSERLYFALARNEGVDVRVARFHNIYGPFGTWIGGKEKAPAAICRKVIQSENGEIEVWGDGQQTRSFLFIDDCIEAVRRFMEQDSFSGPVNIGSEEMVTINELVALVSGIAGKEISIRHTTGPTGVRGRNSNNDLIRETLDWDYTWSLEAGISKTYTWILEEVAKLSTEAASA